MVSQVPWVVGLDWVSYMYLKTSRSSILLVMFNQKVRYCCGLLIEKERRRRAKMVVPNGGKQNNGIKENSLVQNPVFASTHLGRVVISSQKDRGLSVPLATKAALSIFQSHSAECHAHLLHPRPLPPHLCLRCQDPRVDVF